MKAFGFALSLILAALCPAGANETARVPHGDPAMAAAYRKAAASFDAFLAAWRHPPAGAKRFAVKLGIVAATAPPGFRIVAPGEIGGGIVEYFWIGDLRETPKGFEGAIHNKPEHVPALLSGQRLAFARAEIADWTYFQNGKIVGNATACPALAHASAEEREQMREQYGLQCD